MIIYIIAFAVLVLLDQCVKYLAAAYLKFVASMAFIPKVMDFIYVENRGAAFGIFTDSKWFLIGVTSLFMIAILIYMLKIKDKGDKKLLMWSLTLILAGGVGNLIDRIFQGYVVDYFHLLFMEYPCFNIADCCVVIGAVLLVIYVLFFESKSKEKKD